MEDSMKPEKFHAADYTPTEVEAAKRVMIEVAQNLGEYADACVVVGGWVPELLLPDAEPKHTGSINVDLALNPERLSGERYASLLDALKRKGYQPGERPFQLFKDIKIGRETIRVDVEFLAPKGAKMKTSRPKRVPGFRVLETEGCALAFDDPAIVTIEGTMPDEAEKSRHDSRCLCCGLSCDEGLRPRGQGQAEGCVRHLFLFEKLSRRASCPRTENSAPSSITEKCAKDWHTSPANFAVPMTLDRSLWRAFWLVPIQMSSSFRHRMCLARCSDCSGNWE